MFWDFMASFCVQTQRVLLPLKATVTACMWRGGGRGMKAENSLCGRIRGRLQAAQVPKVQDFKGFGSSVLEYRECDKEVKRWRGEDGVDEERFQRGFVTKGWQLRSKKFYKRGVRPAVLYGQWCWQKDRKQNINCQSWRCWASPLGATTMNKIRN